MELEQGEGRAYVPSGLSPLAGRPGGKFYLARRIVARIPEHLCYCEPFCGALWVLFRKSPSRRECVNDINDDIFRFFETVRSQTAALIERGRWVIHSRAQHRAFLEEPLPAWEDDAVERAFRLYYLKRSSFLGTGWRKGKPSFSSGPVSGGALFTKEFFTRQIERAAARLAGVILEHMDWRALLPLYDRPGTFFYLDPPYPGTSFDYGRPWQWPDYEELATALAGLRGRFLLSINDLPECREIFRNFILEEISGPRPMAMKNAKARELLIRNYEYDAQTLKAISKE